MYAIIRAGGKQTKVQSGDVLDIERVKGGDEKLTFQPLLVVDDEGNAISDRSRLAKASVTAKILGEASGEKIDIFKYKNKTGYRRRQGHRQKYTRIEITGIKLPATAKKAASEKETGADAAGAKSSGSKTTGAKKPAAKASTAKSSTTRKPTAKTSTKKSKAASEEE